MTTWGILSAVETHFSANTRPLDNYHVRVAPCTSAIYAMTTMKRLIALVFVFISCAAFAEQQSANDMYLNGHTQKPVAGFTMPHSATGNYSELPALQEYTNGAVIDAQNRIISHNSNSVVVIVRAGQQIGCTSVYHALTQLISGDTMYVMPGIHAIDNCAWYANYDKRTWDGLKDISIIGIGKVMLTAHVYNYPNTKRYPLLFMDCTNFLMSNVTIDTHRNDYGYCFGIINSINVLIEKCKFFMRLDASGTVNKTLVLLPLSNNVVRSCVVGSFCQYATGRDAEVGNFTNYLAHVAVHAPSVGASYEYVIFDDCDFVDNGVSEFTVGGCITKNCRASTRSPYQENLLPLSKARGRQLTDHLYDNYVGGYDNGDILNEPIFALTPIYNKYIVISPNLPNVMGYCGNTFAGAVPNCITGTVRVYGFNNVIADSYTPSNLTNTHISVDYSGCTFKSGAGLGVMVIENTHNSYIEMNNMYLTDASCDYSTTNMYSWGVRVRNCKNNIFIMKNSTHEQTYVSDKLNMLTAVSEEGNINNKCITYNCVRITSTNGLYGLNQCGTIDTMTLDFTNRYSSKPVLTQ